MLAKAIHVRRVLVKAPHPGKSQGRLLRVNQPLSSLST